MSSSPLHERGKPQDMIVASRWNTSPRDPTSRSRLSYTEVPRRKNQKQISLPSRLPHPQSPKPPGFAHPIAFSRSISPRSASLPFSGPSYPHPSAASATQSRFGGRTTHRISSHLPPSFLFRNSSSLANPRASAPRYCSDAGTNALALVKSPGHGAISTPSLPIYQRERSRILTPGWLPLRTPPSLRSASITRAEGV